VGQPYGSTAVECGKPLHGHRTIGHSLLQVLKDAAFCVHLPSTSEILVRPVQQFLRISFFFTRTAPYAAALTRMMVAPEGMSKNADKKIPIVVNTTPSRIA